MISLHIVVFLYSALAILGLNDTKFRDENRIFKGKSMRSEPRSIWCKKILTSIQREEYSFPAKDSEKGSVSAVSNGNVHGKYHLPAFAVANCESYFSIFL